MRCDIRGGIKSSDDPQSLRRRPGYLDAAAGEIPVVAPREPVDGFTRWLGFDVARWQALVVDASGVVLRHVVGTAVLTDRLNSRRCVEELLRRPE